MTAPKGRGFLTAIKELGDIRILGRYQWESLPTNFLFGIKLPTGEYRLKNDEGDEAERSLQPGTGATDFLLGASYHRNLISSPWSWFTQALWQRHINERDEYSPGYQFGIDGGIKYSAGRELGLMAQLNVLSKGRDHGEEGEPDDTGGRFVFFTPGVSLSLGSAIQVYAFIQQPLYQRVNGVQLTAERAFTTGVSVRF